MALHQAINNAREEAAKNSDSQGASKGALEKLETALREGNIEEAKAAIAHVKIPGVTNGEKNSLVNSGDTIGVHPWNETRQYL